LDKSLVKIDIVAKSRFLRPKMPLQYRNQLFTVLLALGVKIRIRASYWRQVVGKPCVLCQFWGGFVAVAGVFCLVVVVTDGFGISVFPLVSQSITHLQVCLSHWADSPFTLLVADRSVELIRLKEASPVQFFTVG